MDVSKRRPIGISNTCAAGSRATNAGREPAERDHRDRYGLILGQTFRRRRVFALESRFVEIRRYTFARRDLFDRTGVRSPR